MPERFLFAMILYKFIFFFLCSGPVILRTAESVFVFLYSDSVDPADPAFIKAGNLLLFGFWMTDWNQAEGFNTFWQIKNFCHGIHAILKRAYAKHDGAKTKLASSRMFSVQMPISIWL